MKNSALGHKTSKFFFFFFPSFFPETVIYDVDFLKIELPSGPYMFIIKCW